MQITVEQLLKIIINAEYLTDEQKNEILNAAMFMDEKEITELAYIFANAEIEKRNYQVEQDLVPALLAQIFAEYNKKVDNDEQKQSLKDKKEKTLIQEERNLNKILKKLDNE